MRAVRVRPAGRPPPRSWNDLADAAASSSTVLAPFRGLLQHGDSNFVAQRVAFIQFLPMVATIAPVAAGDAPGSVIDILALEVAEAFKQPQADVAAIRDRVAQVIFCCGTGRAAIGPYVVSLEQLRDEFRQRAERAREIVAISRSGYTDIGKTKVAGWLKGRWRSPEDAEGRVANLTELLTEDIRQRGDKRIGDAATVAARFMESVRSNAGMARGLQKSRRPTSCRPRTLIFPTSGLTPRSTRWEIWRCSGADCVLRITCSACPGLILRRALRKPGFPRARVTASCALVNVSNVGAGAEQQARYWVIIRCPSIQESAMCD